MLKNIITLLISVFPAILLAQDNGGKVEFPNTGKKFSLTGKITGRDSGIVTLSYTNTAGKFIKDTMLLDKSRFKFDGVISQPTLATIIGTVKTKNLIHPNRVRVFIEPGNMEVSLTEDDFAHAKFKGSKTQVEFDKLNKQMQLLRPGESNQFMLNYITSHPNSFISSVFLWETFFSLSIDTVKAMYGRLSPDVQQSSSGLFIARELKSSQLAKVGDVAADFTAKDVNGEVISLKDFKGKKYVLLKFWFDGCVNCVLQNPQLKQLYQTYKDKDLEVIGISRDDQKTWKKAIEKEGTGIWQNVNQYQVTESANDWQIQTNYNVDGFPTLILINKEGKIVYRTTGFSEEKGLKALEEYLTGL